MRMRCTVGGGPHGPGNFAVHGRTGGQLFHGVARTRGSWRPRATGCNVQALGIDTGTYAPDPPPSGAAGRSIAGRPAGAGFAIPGDAQATRRFFRRALRRAQGGPRIGSVREDVGQRPSPIAIVEMEPYLNLAVGDVIMKAHVGHGSSSWAADAGPLSRKSITSAAFANTLDADG